MYRTLLPRLRTLPSLPMRASYATRSPPPKPLPFQASTPEVLSARNQALAKRAAAAAAGAAPPPPSSPLSYLWPFNPKPSATSTPPPTEVWRTADPARGLEAAREAAITGKLDPRYRSAKWRVLAAICGMPFAIVLSWELWQRRFNGKEMKVRKAGSEKGEGEGEKGAVKTVG